MGDPISVRQVMASTDITERIQKAEAATNQALSEEFTKELSRQETLNQSRIVKKDENDKVEIREEEKRRREEERKKREAKESGSEEENSEDADSEEKHIIDLKV